MTATEKKAADRERARIYVFKMMETREDDFDLAKCGEDAAFALQLGRFGQRNGVLRRHAPPWLRSMLLGMAERWGKA